MPRQQISSEPGALTVRAFCQWAGVSRAWAYERIKSGTIRSVKRGGKRLIPMGAAQAWLAGREEQAAPQIAEKLSRDTDPLFCLEVATLTLDEAHGYVKEGSSDLGAAVLRVGQNHLKRAMELMKQ